MSRFALSFALVSVASSLFVVGCAANAPPDASGESTQADDLACVYTSTGHVIDCVSPPEPSTTTGLPIDPPATSGSSASSSSGSSVTKPGSGSSSASSSSGTSKGPSTGSSGSTTTVCAALQAELAQELGAAQACTVGSKGSTAAPLCDAWVPVWDECSQPVADPGSAATQKYLATYAQYTAANCPVDHLPCVAPIDETSSCEANPATAGGHLGHCAIGGGSPEPGASSAE